MPSVWAARGVNATLPPSSIAMSGDDLVTALAERLQAVADDATYADNYKVVCGERLARAALAFVAERGWMSPCS